ncbi:MAG: TfoX/Sxy family protein [Flavobacteriales bacterium]|nr:TfoX/Sxy family protein [Flavobacteriales bacterium]
MAYNEFLADRIRNILRDQKTAFEEKKMMGGLCIMVDDKMCIGVMQDELMARVDPDNKDTLLKKKGARIMDFTGKPMKGFLIINASGIDNETDLSFWVNECLAFNPKAKSSKKGKGK